ncbi:MAG: DUF401 domain-containing protein [Burkholderia sp.]|jgi:uncharacterized protein
MSVFTLIALVIVLTAVLLRFKCPIGPAILAGGALLWLFENPTLAPLVASFKSMITSSRTWDLIFALYFIMCLEVELRESGTLARMVTALRRVASTKTVIAVMPAFLGLLPSLGGARFSAPIVAEACRGTDIPAHDRAAANYWFRHICEFCSPIVPGMILGCAITHVHVGDMVVHLLWLSVVVFAAGWFFIMRPQKVPEDSKAGALSPEEKKENILSIVLAVSPVVFNLVLMLAFGIGAGLSTGITAALLFPLLIALKHPVPLKHVLVGALDKKLLFNTFCILYFVELLGELGILKALIDGFSGSGLPMAVIIAAIAALLGILTGISQAYIAIIMPLVAGIDTGGSYELTMNYAGIAMVFGYLGQILTPTHLCFTISVDYFHTDFLKTLVPVAESALVVGIVFSLWTYFMW